MTLQNRIQLLKNGDVSAVDTVQNYINNKQTGSNLNVFVNRYDEECLDQAKQLDNKIKNNQIDSNKIK